MWYKAQSFCMYAGEEPDKVAIYVGKLRSVIDRCGPNPFKKVLFLHSGSVLAMAKA